MRNKAVNQLDLNRCFIEKYNSQHIASRSTNVNQSDISSVCSGKRKTAGGFKWSYAILLLFLSLNCFSQAIDITKVQQKRINSIFTSEKIIDLSKAVSNEKRQRDSIATLQSKIKQLKSTIEKINQEHIATLTDIAKINAKAKETSTEVDEVSDEQLKKERFKWAGIHLYSGVEIPKFEFNNINFNTELRYEFEKFEIGLKGDYRLVPLIDKSEYQFNYYLKASWKLF